MKRNVLLVAFVLGQVICVGQKDFYTANVDATVYKKILKKVNLQTDSFAKTLNNFSKFDDRVLDAFCLDTFKINAICNERMNYDFSTSGMNVSVLQLTSEYDKLLNKYYKLLLEQLTVKDKKILQTAQRAWLKYKESEMQLNEVVRKDAYSGGGTIQSNLYVGRNFDIVKQRTDEIFNYYYDIYINK